MSASDSDVSRNVSRDLDRLADLLVDHAMVVVSGAKAAAELGIPHSTLQERVDRLREFGAEIEGIPGRGFRLKSIPDILTASVIREAARGTQFGSRVHHHYSVGSTMDEAADLAHRGAPHGAIVVAEEQTAGRGRMGRAWHSERSGGIYCSLVLRPPPEGKPLPAARAPILTLSAALAVADAVEEIAGVRADLRWPNDVLAGGRKCCGILTEMTAEAERVRHIVLGIGLNVSQREFPPEVAAEATSLARVAGRRVSRAAALAAMLAALDRRLRQFLDFGGAAILSEFEKRSSFAHGRHVRVESEGLSFTGLTQGLDASGFLLVLRDDLGEVEPILAGKVRPI